MSILLRVIVHNTKTLNFNPIMPLLEDVHKERGRRPLLHVLPNIV